MLFSTAIICAKDDPIDNEDQVPLYDDLVQACLSGQEIDFYNLRMSYTKSNYYNVFGSEEKIKLVELVSNENYSEAIDLIFENVYKHLAELEFINYALIALEAMQDRNLEFFYYIFYNLLYSIEDSGDGKSEETAFEVISIKEEYIYMVMYDIQHSMQELIETEEHIFDRFLVTPNELYNESYVYFLVDRLFEAYADMGL